MKRDNMAKIILGVVAFIVIIVGFFAYRYFFTLYITNTEPEISNFSYMSPNIKLQFNKKINKESVIIDDKSDIFYLHNTVIGDKEIIIPINTLNLQINEEFSFVLSVNSIDGYSIKNKDVSITPKDIPYEKLSQEQKDAITKVQNQKPDYYTDPLLDIIPYSTLNYAMQPNFKLSEINNDTLTVDIKITLSNIDIKEGEEKAVNKYRNEALDYIRSNGLNPNDYIIRTAVSKP